MATRQEIYYLGVRQTEGLVASLGDLLQLAVAIGALAVSAGLMATDLADYLVDRGVAFRDAHKAVGSIVREAEQSGAELHTLPKAVFAAAHPAFGDDVFDALSPVRSVERREVDGGTGPAAVKRQLAAARASLAPLPEARGNELTVMAG